jgi:ribosomal protein S10
MLNTIKKSTVIHINLKSFSHNILKYYLASFIALTKFKNIKIKVQPLKKKNLTILKSPHKYKKAQDHFQLKIYKSVLIINEANVSDFMFLLINKPEGLFINIKMKQIINK